MLAQLEDEDTIPPDILAQLEDEDPAPVAVQEPPQEFEHTYIHDFDLTVGTPKGLPPEERDKLVSDFMTIQPVNPYEEDMNAAQFPSEKPQAEKAPEQVPLSSLEQIGNQILDLAGAQDRVPAETVTTEQTGVVAAATYPSRRIAGHIEKAGWAAVEGIIRAERALYKYAPDRLTDMWIKGMEKKAKVARLTRQIDYWMKPEKYGWVSPQVDLDRKLNEETAYRRNYAYGLLNSSAEAATDFVGFMTTIGMMPAGTKAVEYGGKALPYLAKNAAHAATTLAPYALATTPGGIYPRLHSALILTSFGMVKPLINLTGFRKFTATMAATAMNAALTSPEVVEMYKQKGGFNQEFFKLFVPWITMNFAFGVYMKDALKAQQNQIGTRFAKAMVETFGVPLGVQKNQQALSLKEVLKADKPKIESQAVEGFKPSEREVQLPEDSPQGAAVEAEPTTLEAALPPKYWDFKIPESVSEYGDKSKKKYDFSKDWKNDDTQEGLKQLAAELGTLEESRYTLLRDGDGNVIERPKVSGESPEHLRGFKPRRFHKGEKSDLDLVNELIITKNNESPKNQTKKQHDRVAAFLKAQQKHANRKMQEGQDYVEGKGERPLDEPSKEVSDEQKRLEEEERLAIQEESQPDISQMSPEEYEAYQKKRKSVGAAGEEVTGEIPLPDLPNEVVVITEKGERKTIRPKEDEAFSIVPIKGTDGKVRYQLHDGQVYDISASEAAKLMEYAGVKEKNKKFQQDILAMTEDEYVSRQGKNVSGQSVKKTENLARTYYRYLKSREGKSVGAKGLKPGEGQENNPHYQAVKKALEEGKPVPEKAYASYPDLKKQYGKPPSQTPPPTSTAATGGFPGDSFSRESQFARNIVEAHKGLKGTQFVNLAHYFSKEMAEQRELARQMIAENPGFAAEIAMGGVPPSGSKLQGISVFIEMANNADGEMALKLAKSQYASMVSQAGSTLSAVSHLMNRDELDPVQTIKKIQEHNEDVEKRLVKKDLPYSVLKEKLAKAEERLAKAEAKLAKGEPIEPSAQRERTVFGAKNKIVTKSMKEEAEKRLRSKLMGLRANIDPTAMIEIVEIGTFYAEGGYREFKAWSEKMIAEYGDKLKPYLPEAWKQIQDRFNKESLEKAKKGIKQVVTEEGELSDIGKYLKEINRQVQGSGVKGQDKILDAIYEIVHDAAPDMTKEEMRDAISGYGKYKELSKEELEVQIRDIKGQWQKIAAIEDLMRKQAPKKTGVERRTPTDEERALIKKVNELKKKYNIQTTDPARQLKSALDSIKTRLINQIKDLTTQIDSGEKLIKETTPPPSDAEVVALRKTRDMLRKEYDKIFFEPRTDAQKIAAATKAAERTVAELQRRIDEGKLTPAEKEASQWSPEISQLKQEAEGLRNQIAILKEMENPSLTPEERAINALKRRLERTEKSYEEKLANLDFTKKQKPAPLTGPGIEKMRSDTQALRDAFNAAEKAKDINVAEANELVRLSKIAMGKREVVPETDPARSPKRMEYGRAKSDFLDYADKLRHRAEELKLSDFKAAPIRASLKALLEIPGLMKASVAALDNSALGNQGLKIVTNHPKIWGRNAIKSFLDIYGTLSGKEMMREVRADIFSRQNYMNGIYKRHKLYFGSEESFPTSILAKTPVLGRLFKSSETAYTGFIHRSRADIFDFYYERMSKAGIDTEGLGDLVNSLTGRGNMGKLEAASDRINLLLFSGRYLKSNFDMLTLNLSPARKMSPEVRAKAVKNAAVAWATIASLSLLTKLIAHAFGDDDAVEADPRSSAFGKIKLGHTYFDITGGAASLVTLLARFGGVKNRRTGIIAPVFGEDRVAQSAWDLLIRFGEGKMSPFAAYLRDMLSNMTDWEGKKLTLANAPERVVPITASSAVEGFQASEGNLPIKLGKTSGISITSGVGLGASSEIETPEQMVKDAKAIEKEFARLKRIGDYKGIAALKKSDKVMRIVRLAGANAEAETKTPLRKKQDEINDLKSDIRNAQQNMRYSEPSRKQLVKSLEKKLEMKQKYIDAYFNEIK
jgi:hypothetical protein